MNWRWIDRKNRENFFFRGASNSHLARLQDFWNLKGNQLPVREAQVKWSQKAREYHLVAWQVERKVRG